MVYPQIPPPQGKSASGKSALIGPSESQEASSSQQNNSGHRRTTSPSGAQSKDARNKYDKQTKPAPHSPWDGIITDKPNFPLSEIIGLKQCNFSADFYAYARMNGRTGVIARNLIEDILKSSRAMDDFEPEQPKAEEPEARFEQRDPKGKGKAKEGNVARTVAAQSAAAGSDQAAEAEIIIQTFEQVCEELKTCLVGMDTGRYTESGRPRTRGRSRRSLAQHASAAVAAPSSSTSSAIDPRTYCAVPRPSPSRKAAVKGMKNPNAGEPEALEEEIQRLKRLSSEWETAAGKRADDVSRERLSYSKAAKAAVDYYTLTSAYWRQPQNVPDDDGGAPQLIEGAGLLAERP